MPLAPQRTSKSVVRQAYEVKVSRHVVPGAWLVPHRFTNGTFISILLLPQGMEDAARPLVPMPSKSLVARVPNHGYAFLILGDETFPQSCQWNWENVSAGLVQFQCVERIGQNWATIYQERFTEPVAQIGIGFPTDWHPAAHMRLKVDP